MTFRSCRDYQLYGTTLRLQAGSDDKFYVVQTSTKVIERCMLMATDPGTSY